jgi:hypothetical protein
LPGGEVSVEVEGSIVESKEEGSSIHTFAGAFDVKDDAA